MSSTKDLEVEAMLAALRRKDERAVLAIGTLALLRPIKDSADRLGDTISPESLNGDTTNPPA